MKIIATLISALLLLSSLESLANSNAGPDQIVCLNSTVTMAATGTGIWTQLAGNPAATIINNGSSPVTTMDGFNLPGTYIYMWGTGGVWDTVNVTVYSQPIVDAGPTAHLCNGSSVQLGGAPTASGGSGHYQYMWTPGSGLSSVTSANPTAYPPSDVTYTVFVTDSVSGCQITDTVSVYISPNILAVSTTFVHDVSCHGANDGSVCVSVTGGLAPYTYSWTGGTTTPCPTGLFAGIYTVSVTDANGCIATLPEVITEPALYAVTETHLDVLCNGNNTGVISLTRSGGTPPYAIPQWSDGQTGLSRGNLPAGTYAYTDSDANGCPASGSVIIAQPVSGFSVSESHVDVLCHGGATASITLTLSGGTTAYNPVTWTGSPGASGTAPTGLSAGTYTYNVTDANNCLATGNITITEPNPLVLSASVVDESSPGANDGRIYLTASGGTPPYSYTWSSPGLFGPTATSLAVGIYRVTVIDANGCSLIDSAEVSTCHICVWPGDADANHLVDNNDLLPIGLGYDSVGPARQSVSIVWQGYAATDWADSFSSYTPAVNFKYADCNGDGVIDANDTTAIMQNFGLTHSKTRGASAPWRTGLPALYPALSKDTVTNGDTLQININLGDISLNATNVYGIAFTLNYDPAVVDTTKTSMSFGNSWLGTATDKIAIYKDLKSQGAIKVAITRIDHTTRSGQGQIAFVRAIVTTDNIDGKDLQYYPFSCNISDVTAIDASGRVIDLNEGADSSAVGYTPLSVAQIGGQDEKLSIYPNPANNDVTLISAKTSILSVDVINVLGETVASHLYNDQRRERTIDLHALSSGVYYVSIRTQSGSGIRRVVVSH